MEFGILIIGFWFMIVVGVFLFEGCWFCARACVGVKGHKRSIHNFGLTGSAVLMGDPAL